MEWNGFVAAAYVLILGTLAGYALRLRARLRSLERAAHDSAPGSAEAGTLSSREDP
jgi:hypothetical protein